MRKSVRILLLKYTAAVTLIACAALLGYGYHLTSPSYADKVRAKAMEQR